MYIYIYIYVMYICQIPSPGTPVYSPLQYSCLENSTDIGAWWATVHGVAKTEHIGMHACYFRTWPLPRFWSLLALHLNLGGTFDSL